MLFRTAEGTKLRAAVGRDVAFGADGYDAGAGQVWSVVVKGHRAVRAAVRDGCPLVQATLAAEADEPVGGRSAEAYFAARFGGKGR